MKSKTDLFEQALSTIGLSDRENHNSNADWKRAPQHSFFKDFDITLRPNNQIRDEHGKRGINHMPYQERLERDNSVKLLMQRKVSPPVNDSRRFLSPQSSSRNLYKPLLNKGSGSK